MRKTRIISLALVAMLFFSLTAFTPAAKAVKAGSNLGTPITLQAKPVCAHEFGDPTYGEWTLVATERVPGYSYMYLKKYERTVTKTCKKCGYKTTSTESKTVLNILNLIDLG